MKHHKTGSLDLVHSDLVHLDVHIHLCPSVRLYPYSSIRPVQVRFSTFVTFMSIRSLRIISPVQVHLSRSVPFVTFRSIFQFKSIPGIHFHSSRSHPFVQYTSIPRVQDHSSRTSPFIMLRAIRPSTTFVPCESICTVQVHLIQIRPILPVRVYSSVNPLGAFQSIRPVQIYVRFTITNS